MTEEVVHTHTGQSCRVRVFVDYWNFQLTLNERCGGERVRVDWKMLGEKLAARACMQASIPTHSYDGTIIYCSYNAATTEGRKFRGWATNFLDKQPGIQVVAVERRPKNPPTCPSCHKRIERCPHCSEEIRPTTEKGVDTRIATDMIRLAWENAYDLAVLATLDGDLVPAVEFLDLKGQKVVQAGFPPQGTHLARACWASFDVAQISDDIRRDR